MLRGLSLALLMVSGIQSAWAKGPSYIGYGTSSCVEYMQVVNSNKRDSALYALAYEAWAMGKLSGVNLFIHSAKGIDLLTKIDASRVRVYLRNY
ncbi:MAG: hypothetical protein AB1418_03665, partial [Pseudomonadota bacterium]